MSGLWDSITGKASRDARNAQQSIQRRSLADLAAQSAELDQGAAPSGRPQRGRRLLTFLGGAGADKLSG